MIMVIDDERSLRDGENRNVLYLRNSKNALLFLRHYTKNVAIDELYLDHDLGGEDTIRPVVDFLEEMVFSETPLSIGTIFVHTANPVGADMILKSRLLTNQYKVVRIGLENFIV